MDLDSKHPTRLILVGSMGAGKTTLGQLVAQQAGLPFFDSDEEIEKRSGADISWIFDKEGEAGFREREGAMLAELLEQPEFILATGGGIVLRKDNRELLKQKGFVVYLKISLNRQLKRLSLDSKRPLLQNTDHESVLRKLKSERDALYEEVADLVVSVNGDDVKRLVAQILKVIEKNPLS